MGKHELYPGKGDEPGWEHAWQYFQDWAFQLPLITEDNLESFLFVLPLLLPYYSLLGYTLPIFHFPQYANLGHIFW